MAAWLERTVLAHVAQYASLDDLQRRASEQMIAYEDAEAARAQALLQRAAAPDADGFVTVVNRRVATAGFGERTAVAPGLADAVEHEEAAQRTKRAAKRARRAAVGGAFYGPVEGAADEVARGPRGEGERLRRDQIADLRRRFAEDRQKLADLKAGRLAAKDEPSS